MRTLRAPRNVYAWPLPHVYATANLQEVIKAVCSVLAKNLPVVLDLLLDTAVNRECAPAGAEQCDILAPRAADDRDECRATQSLLKSCCPSPPETS